VFSYKQNKSPFAIALGDWFPFRSNFSTSQASPNDQGIIVIVIIVIVDEAKSVFHIGGIIAQRVYFHRVTLLRASSPPQISANALPIHRLIIRNKELNSK
jgi:hypothetical protein